MPAHHVLIIVCFTSTQVGPLYVKEQNHMSKVQGFFIRQIIYYYILERHCWVCFQITLLVFYAYVERTIAPDHQVGLN